MIFKYSVITTVYNDQDTIIRFLDDICNQTLLPREIIITDGGSSDKTIDLIRQYIERSIVHIFLLYGDRLNISQGFNRAIKASTEGIIAITSVGNAYPQNYMELLAKEFDGYDATYGTIRGCTTTVFSRLYNKVILNNELITKIPTNHGVMIKKSVVEELGYFYESFAYAGEDYELYTRFLNKGYKAKCVPDAYCIWDVPLTFSDYKRQIRVYLVGFMQAEKNYMIFKDKKVSILLSLCFVFLLFSLLLRNLHLLTVLLGIVLFLVCRWFVRYGFYGMLLKVSTCILETYYIIIYHKYFNYNNKIDPTRRL